MATPSCHEQREAAGVPEVTLEPRLIRDAPESRQEPVRVLYIVDQLTEMGGAERFLVKMIRSLPKERFRCSVVTFQIDRSLPLFSSMPCDVRVLPLRKSYDARALRFSLELRRFIRSEGVSIVHTFFETADLWGGLVSRLSRVPIILSSRRDMGILRRPKHALAYRFVNPLFTRVLAVSEEVRRCCIEVDHLRPERVETVYNGVEFPSSPLESRDACRERLGLSDFKEIVLTIGNIRRVKGIDIFLRAAANVCKSHPSALFVIVGDNHDPVHFNELNELISELGISRNVLFFGPSEDIARFLAACDVFCLPSRSEGFSNALIEAMGAGVPCVATRVGGNVEALEHNRNGVLVPREDATALSSAIEALLDDPTRARVLGRKARETVQARFSHEAMMTQLTNIYERLVLAAGR
jgi:glycosyltransferase involved in cell wall biosynthesis